MALYSSCPIALSILLSFGLTPAADVPAGKLWVYIGTYTDGASKGIYRFEMDTASGALSARTLVAETANPSFLALHSSHRFLYAVNETDRFAGAQSGGVSAFALNPRSGALKFLNQQASGGTFPCHLTVDREGKHVLVANYGSGSVAVLPLQADGRLAEASARVQHHGAGADPKRQQGPHAHSINLDAANRFAVVADLGLDKVFLYRFDPSKDALLANEPPFVSTRPGAGPRHFAFHPDGLHAYVINETNSTLTAFRYDAETGALKDLQTISTLPTGFTGSSYCAEVVVHPSGRFLYGSNRGHDSIVIFAIDPETGKLRLVGHQGGPIKIPRNFAIDPTGNYLLVANQSSNNLVVFRIDLKTGALTQTGAPVEVPAPVCVRMIWQEG